MVSKSLLANFDSMHFRCFVCTTWPSCLDGEDLKWDRNTARSSRALRQSQCSYRVPGCKARLKRCSDPTQSLQCRYFPITYASLSCMRKCYLSEWCASGSRTRASSKKRVAQEDAVVPDDRAAAGTCNGAAQGGGCEGIGIKLLLVL